MRRSLLGLLSFVGVLLVLVSGLALLTPSETASAQGGVIGRRHSYTTVSATQANSVVTFGFNPARVVVINDGANEVFVSLAASIATTSDIRLNANEVRTFDALTFALPTLGVICSTGETASVRVIAW